jgi:hypothetical protein
MAVIRMLDFDAMSYGHNNKESSGSEVINQVQTPVVNQTLATSQVVPDHSVHEQKSEKGTVFKADLATLSHKNWPHTFKQLNLKGGSRELARHMELLENTDNVITFGVDQSAEIFMNEKAQNAIRENLLENSTDYQVRFKMKSEVNSVAKQVAAQQSELTTQMNQVDPVVAELQSQFDAKIIQNKLGD